MISVETVLLPVGRRLSLELITSLKGVHLCLTRRLEMWHLLNGLKTPNAGKVALSVVEN